MGDRYGTPAFHADPAIHGNREHYPGMEPTKGLTVDKETAKKKVLNRPERYGMKVDPDAKVEDISVGMSSVWRS